MVIEADIGKLVRIKPCNGSPHWMRGRLVGITSGGRMAEVHPFTHRKTERVPIKNVQVWKAKA